MRSNTTHMKRSVYCCGTQSNTNIVKGSVVDLPCMSIPSGCRKEQLQDLTIAVGEIATAISVLSEMLQEVWANRYALVLALVCGRVARCGSICSAREVEHDCTPPPSSKKELSTLTMFDRRITTVIVSSAIERGHAKCASSCRQCNRGQCVLVCRAPLHPTHVQLLWHIGWHPQVIGQLNQFRPRPPQ